MSLFWLAEYVKDPSPKSIFNRKFRSEYEEDKYLPQMPELVGDLFNDGGYDTEACTVLNILGSDSRYFQYFRDALSFVNDDDEAFVYFNDFTDPLSGEREITVKSEQSFSGEADDHLFGENLHGIGQLVYCKRVTLTELKRNYNV